MSKQPPAFVSVDIEASGPSPSRHALLSIGACLVDDPTRGFYAELRPSSHAVDPAAMRVHGLSLDELAARGEEPATALRRFEDWLADVTDGRTPVFVGHNAAFDWMFVADAFHRHLGHNPFGHAPLDMKSFFAGLTGEPWSGTGLERIAARFGETATLPHHALDDARIQARLFAAMLHRAQEAP
jgi:DNA polymerase III epsilon subunit-like protein